VLANNFQLCYPISILEQQRIVAKLDKAFEAIASVKEQAEQNLLNARALFDSYLDDVFSKRGEGWIERKLVDLTAKIGSGATPLGGQDSYKADGTSLIRSLNVHDGGFRYEKLAFIDEEQANGLANVTIEQNDVLLNITGASVARCCVVPIDVLPARVNQHVSIIRAKPNLISYEFLYYALTSRSHKKKLLKIGDEGGSTRQAITKAQLQEYDLSYPAELSAQKEINERVKLIREQTQALEAIYEQKINALAELKQSLLHQAFSGEL
jgi:type I restriction enzyme S subunit